MTPLERGKRALCVPAQGAVDFSGRETGPIEQYLDGERGGLLRLRANPARPQDGQQQCEDPGCSCSSHPTLSLPKTGFSASPRASTGGFYQMASSRSSLEPARLATIRTPLFKRTWTRAAS